MICRTKNQLYLANENIRKVEDKWYSTSKLSVSNYVSEITNKPKKPFKKESKIREVIEHVFIMKQNLTTLYKIKNCSIQLWVKKIGWEKYWKKLKENYEVY